jgi:pantetheine-phosphate adenylyltransferase
MRITAGRHRGRPLRSPKGQGTRPTSDLLRQAIFNVIGPRLEGSRVLDLYAGTGAVGLEALSRGAAHATFVERDHGAVRSLRANVQALGVGASARILVLEVGAALRRLAGQGERFDCVFLDPPYRREEAARCLEWLAPGDVFGDNALLVVQAFHREVLPAERGVLRRTWRRRYGESSVTLYQAAVADGRSCGPGRSGEDRTADREPANHPVEGVCMASMAVYPGTFDPFTYGHIDLVRRCLRLFPRLVVAVANNPHKTPLFTLEERVAIVTEATADMPGVEVDTFSDLTVDYVRRKGAQVILRGVRAVSDFEFEFAMALMNRKMHEEIETLFLMPNEAYTYISSRLVKEVALLGGSVDELVPPLAAKLLRARASQRPAPERRKP